MPIGENKAIVGRWFTEFWGADFNPGVIDYVSTGPHESQKQGVCRT
jgi:hypothetical protein